MPGFLWCSSKWACQFAHFLQYMSGLEVLACSLDTELYYVTTLLLLCPSLNHKVKRKDAATFWVYSHRQIHNHSSALCWTQGPLLNFQKNAQIPYLSSLVDFLSKLAILCYHYIFDTIILIIYLIFGTM